MITFHWNILINYYYVSLFYNVQLYYTVYINNSYIINHPLFYIRYFIRYVKAGAHSWQIMDSSWISKSDFVLTWFFWSAVTSESRTSLRKAITKYTLRQWFWLMAAIAFLYPAAHVCTFLLYSMTLYCTVWQCHAVSETKNKDYLLLLNILTQFELSVWWLTCMFVWCWIGGSKLPSLVSNISLISPV